MRLKSIRDLPIRGKRLFLRLDFNVPISKPDENGTRHVLDDTRIREAIPTIEYARAQGAKIIIASHLGRPKGKSDEKTREEFSMLPAAHHLANLMKIDVTLVDECVGEGIEMKSIGLVPGEVMMLENLRFHQEEEDNDLGFAQALARLCDVYVTDAFGTAHRKHASTYTLPSIMPDRGMGFLIEKELKYFDQILQNPSQPFYLILGGAKVTDKIKTIQSLLKRVKGVLVGGAMAYAFMKAQGKTIPETWKQPSPEDVSASEDILNEASRKGIPFLLPTDTNNGFDVGPETTKKYIEFLATAKTVFWNGPLGWFEKPEYATATNAVAKALSEMSCTKIVGGGDTVSAINQAGFAEKYDHLSTGGGAALEYLENGSLPGIEILRSGHRPSSPDLVTEGDDPEHPALPIDKRDLTFSPDSNKKPYQKA